jgi:hypothetical protein
MDAHQATNPFLSMLAALEEAGSQAASNSNAEASNNRPNDVGLTAPYGEKE